MYGQYANDLCNMFFRDVLRELMAQSLQFKYRRSETIQISVLEDKSFKSVSAGRGHSAHLRSRMVPPSTELKQRVAKAYVMQSTISLMPRPDLCPRGASCQ